MTSAEAISSPPTKHEAWLGALAGAAALAIAMGIGRFAFTPVLPLMLEEGALSLGQGAWLASANYLGYLLGALSAVRWRAATLPVIRVGLFIIALSTLAMALPLNVWMWAALRLAAGIASAWVLISVSSWLMDWVARHRQPKLGNVVFSGVGCGIAAAGVICILTTLFHGGALVSWLALGVIAMGLGAWVLRRFTDIANRMPPKVAASSATNATVDKAIYKWTPQVLRAVASYGLFGFGYIIPATFIPVMARAALAGNNAFVWAWPVFGLAAVLSLVVMAPLNGRISNRWLWIWGQLIMAVAVALPLLSTSLVAIVMSALGVGGTFLAVTLVALQEARRLAGSNASMVIAAMTAAFALGQIIGPLTIVTDDFVIPLAVAASALALGSALLFPRDSKPDPETST